MLDQTASDVVRVYAEAKSRADIDAALRACHPDVVFETIPFQAIARGADEARDQFGGFFRAFPDYTVELEYLRETGDLVVGSGRILATMNGTLAGIPPSGRRFALPFACHWTVTHGKIAHERFFFDFNQMCEQLELSTDGAAARFAAWRASRPALH